MTSDDISRLTGYSARTVIKYASILNIRYLGTGRRKIYDWTDSDIERFLEVIKGADGSRDRRGETEKKLKKIEKKS
jgi:pimeloyl-CoA synthetase